MPARLNTRNDKNAREKIRTTQIINRLENHLDDPEAFPMSPTQLRAAEVLLRKVLPDLSAVDASITDDRSEADISDAELMSIARGEAENEESGIDSAESTLTSCA